jgi:hypothetical protein
MIEKLRESRVKGTKKNILSFLRLLRGVRAKMNLKSKFKNSKPA